MPATRPAKKSTPAEPAKKTREPAAPTATHLAYKLDTLVVQDGGERTVLADVVPFGHRAADEVDAMRWAIRAGYHVVTVPPGVRVIDHLKAEGLL